MVEKEIPFGAFDSELMHQEINIPEGFTATIEGNKIILTRTENEDEKIRKELIEHVKANKEADYVLFKRFSPDNVIAWLEKQGENLKQENYKTTICGKDYKCIKNYKVGNCSYSEGNLYHCGRDGYLTDDNGISWSCDVNWCKEYLNEL